MFVAPNVTTTLEFCSTDNPTGSDLVATDGFSGVITWYSDAALTTVVGPTEALVDGGKYYATETLNGYVSPASEVVTVIIQVAPNAGTDGVLTICEGIAPTASALFAQLGGTPDVGGTWSNVGLVYTYTLAATGTCPGDTATITVTVDPAPNAGTDGTLTICEGTTPTAAALFAQLGGAPDTGGTWSNEGLVYTYTVAVTGSCVVNDTSKVVVSWYVETIILNLLDDEFETEQNTPITFNVLDNDTVSGGEIQIMVASNPSKGAAVFNPDGSITYTPANDFIGQDEFEYQVKVTSPCGVVSVATATITVVVSGVLPDCAINFPGQGNSDYDGYGFSPNGDGYNDYFVIPQLQTCYPNFRIEVYNRWGNIVYDYKHNGNPDSEPLWWDGKSTGRLTINKGEVLPAGTYFYIIHFNKDNMKPVSGYIYLTK